MIKHFKDNESDLLRVREYTAAFAEREGAYPAACVLTFGCQQNEADSERMRGVLASCGYRIVREPKGADVIIVNTCAVREHAEQKVLSVIGQFKHLKAEKPSMIIGVAGCMTAQESRRDTLKRSYPYVDFATGPAGAHRLPTLIAERIGGGRRAFDYTEEHDVCEGVPTLLDSDFRAWVNVMHGCNNFCTYCIVPYVRGRERSRKKEDILAECKRLVESGIREITLLGQNVNSYGRGLYEDYDFADLLSDVCSLEGDFTVRFMTSHPKDATDKLIEVMAKNPKAAKHFHLPLQSGSDRILSAMNRRYTFEKYYEKVKKMRALMPDITITSDIIVAFPTETEEDFEATLEAMRTVRYDMTYSFIYSPRKGTPAADMDGQIPKAVASERFSRLLALQNEIALEKNQAYIGRVVSALCEGESKTDPSMFAARTDGYKTVFFPQSARAGETVKVRIERADPYALYGEIEE